MTTEKISIEGMNSATCIQAIKEALLSQGAKIKKIELGIAEIQYDENEVKRQDIIMAIKEAGYEAIIINNNPETVSTDFSISDKLYFEPLTLEDPVERFMARVEVDDEGCWIWQQHRTSEGYGGYSGVNGGQVLAHRYSYELFVGPIPEGLHIDHLCRVRECVNPDHLEPVTRTHGDRTAGLAREFGPDAEAVLQDLCTCDAAIAPGDVRYTQWLNPKGGIEADLTVSRLDGTPLDPSPFLLRHETGGTSAAVRALAAWCATASRQTMSRCACAAPAAGGRGA